MHLVDVFMPAIAYVARFRVEDEDARPEYRQARGDVLRLLEEAETAAGSGGISRDDFDRGRFAVCAFIDETILSSDWRGRGLWQHEQLQRLFYNTTDAGVELFDRLEALGGEQRDLREVYCLCLLLGFRGRYIGKDDTLHLERLKASNLELLDPEASRALTREEGELFPGALPDTAPGQCAPRGSGFVIGPATLVLAATPVILLALLYLVYRYVLNGLVLPIP